MEAERKSSMFTDQDWERMRQMPKLEREKYLTNTFERNFGKPEEYETVRKHNLFGIFTKIIKKN